MYCMYDLKFKPTETENPMVLTFINSRDRIFKIFPIKNPVFLEKKIPYQSQITLSFEIFSIYLPRRLLK